MFGIKIDNVFADLTPGQNIKLSRWNSVFEFETVRGSIVNDFTLPFTPVNDKIFGWYRNANMSFPNKQYLCEKIADGFVIERGFIELVDVTDREYVVTFTQNLSEVFGEYQNVLLNKIDFGFEAIGTLHIAANHLTDKFCLPTVANAQFYGTNTQAGYNGKMNDWTGGTLNANARVPMLFLRFVFEKIAEICDFTFTGEFFESEVFKRGVVIDTYSLDDATEIRYSNHLPELTISEFLIGLRKAFNLGIFFDVNSRIMRVRFCKDLLNKPAKMDFTKKVSPLAGRTPERNNRLRLDWDLDGGDNVMKRVPLPVGFDPYIGADVQRGFVREIKTRLSTIHVEAGLATIEQAGASIRFNQAGQKFGFRIGLWGGVVSGVPVVTNVLGSDRIAWDGSNNLRTTYWAEFEALIANTSVRPVQANLNAMDLWRLDWHSNPDAEHSLFIRNREYYVASLEVLLPLQGLAQMILWERN